MPFRIGCDLVDLRRFEKSIATRAFIERIFHPEEIAYCDPMPGRVASYAARFAAREAFAKALGCGLYASGVAPQDIWVVRDEAGRPQLRLATHVAALLAQAGFHAHDVSLSHDGHLALATVILSS